MSDTRESDDYDIPFTPVPVRARRDGWTEERQRAMVRAIQRIGSISTSCKAVGKSRRSFYNLLLRPGAESFQEACDLALEEGRDAIRDAVIDRCMHGALVPIFRAGRLTGFQHKYFDKLAIAVLSGRDRSIEGVLEDRLRARRYAKAGRELAAERRQREEEERAYEEELRIAIEKGRQKMKDARMPRIRSL